MYNDGLQPWFSDRKRFGLRSVSCRESSCTEEGLAAINTALRAKEHYLWLSALVYCELENISDMHICPECRHVQCLNVYLDASKC